MILSRPGAHFPYRTFIYQLNRERTIPPTSKLTTSSNEDFLDFSTHYDRDLTPISMEAATQDVEALDALDNQGNE